MLVVAAAGAAEEPIARLQPVDGALVTAGQETRWTIEQDSAALLSLDLPTPGFLSVVVQSDNGVDVQLTMADALGVPYSEGYFDNDPPALAHGELGALLLPAGRVTLVVASWGIPTSGRVETAWLALPDAAPTPPASQAFAAAAAIASGTSVLEVSLPVKEHGNDRTVLYVSPRATAGTIGLTFEPPLGDRVLMGVHASDQVWSETFEFEQSENTLALPAAAGVGYFLVFNHWEADAVPLKLTRRDAGPAPGHPQSVDVAAPAAPALPTRRAPR